MLPRGFDTVSRCDVRGIVARLAMVALLAGGLTLTGMPGRAFADDPEPGFTHEFVGEENFVFDDDVRVAPRFFPRFAPRFFPRFVDDDFLFDDVRVAPRFFPRFVDDDFPFAGVRVAPRFFPRFVEND